MVGTHAWLTHPMNASMAASSVSEESEARNDFRGVGVRLVVGAISELLEVSEKFVPYIKEYLSYRIEGDNILES